MAKNMWRNFCRDIRQFWRCIRMVITVPGMFMFMLMVNKEAQQNRTRTVSPAAIPSKANYRVKSKKHL